MPEACCSAWSRAGRERHRIPLHLQDLHLRAAIGFPCPDWIQTVSPHATSGAPARRTAINLNDLRVIGSRQMQERGVEPLHLSVQDPKSCASANSATPAASEPIRSIPPPVKPRRVWMCPSPPHSRSGVRLHVAQPPSGVIDRRSDMVSPSPLGEGRVRGIARRGLASRSLPRPPRPAPSRPREVSPP